MDIVPDSEHRGLVARLPPTLRGLALLARFDLDLRPGRVTWGYEYYSYKRDKFERRNTFAKKKQAPEVAALMAKLTAFDGCQEVGDQPVSEACRVLRQ